LTRDLPETVAQTATNVMDKGPALHGVGAKEPQDHQRMLTTYTTKLPLETNALAIHQAPTMLTEATIVTETEPALHGVGAKEPRDDH